MAGFGKISENREDTNETIDINVSQEIDQSLQSILGSDYIELSEENKQTIITNILGFYKDANTVRNIGSQVVLSSNDYSISIDIIKLLVNGDPDAVQEISYDEATARQIESETTFQEGIVELDVLYSGILDALERNDEEVWENIDGNDVITEGAFAGKTLVEAVLIYRKKILESSEVLRGLGSLNESSSPELLAAREKLYDANENYLLLIMGIGEEKEELVHVIPKSQEECNTLIDGVVSRRGSRELLDWMKDIHAQIDANNWQSGTVEKNYKNFTESLNARALEKIRQDIFENETSENFRKPDLLLEFTVLVSGRPSWDREGGAFNYDRVSPVDSRLWEPETAKQALIYAMDLPRNSPDDSTQESMISRMLKNMEIKDSLIEEGKSPNQVIEDALNKIKNNITIPTESGNLITLGESQDFDKILEDLKLIKIIEKKDNGTLGETYNSLSLEEMVTISTLARISKKITEKQTETRSVMGASPYVAQAGESVQVHANHGPGPAYISIVTTTKSSIDYLEFNDLLGESVQQGVEHVGSELDRNFDDTWGEVWTNMTSLQDENGNGTWHDEADIARAEKFGLSGNIHSLEYRIFTLYNDISGNGNPGEVSDTMRDGIKTAGFMIAMVAGSVLIGGAAVAALRLSGLAIGLATEGAIMGATGSGLGYGLDSTLGDARGFYTPSEAIIGVGSDFALGAATGAIGGPLVAKYGNPDAAFLSRASIPNKGIFAGDLALLGLGPEYVRIAAVNQAWHGSEIFTESENLSPIESEILQHQTDLFQYELNEDQIEAYFSIPINWEILPRNFENYRVFTQIFHGFGFESSDISFENDRRFLKAYATWKLLHPGSSLSLWQTEPVFIALREDLQQNREGGIEAWKEKILETTMSWIEFQEDRISDII